MLGFLNKERAVTVFWILFGMTILALIGMQITGKPLQTAVAPGGIITFELIGNFEGSQSIISSWQGQAMIYAGLNMGLDFLFLTLYGLTIALGCLLVAERLPTQWSGVKPLGTWLAMGVILAAGLDIVENIALIKLIMGSQNEMLPLLAKWVAIPKFILVLLALLYVIIGVVPVLRKSSR
ncbi:MAG: hypothetical protein L3J79_00390 [Candidatus Marinimicrobia bacterium]|nr:hypothetical protein [Candidatus Neomarinimicrobiota bacterium]